MIYQIFQWHEQLDCFLVDPAYKRLADYLGLTEWHEAVWIGRFFTLDNDYGEHWFDNWDEREAREKQAAALGLASTELLVLNPDRFQDGADGPCHDPNERIGFWRDVLRSVQLSSDTLFREARRQNAANEKSGTGAIPDLEARIQAVRNGYLP